MTEIVPRWEWRTFGSRFGLAEERFAALSSTGVQESDELYLLSGVGDNVKVRADLMDIKTLREVNADGLQQWVPVMKAAFPLPADQVRTVFEALHLEPPALALDAYTLEQFVAELVQPSGVMRAVDVHKRRVRYTAAGCISEVSEITADGKATRTIALELEDPAVVNAGVRAMGLGGYVNTSYPVGLAALLDGQPERFAVIDLGTNSVKFHVGERAPDGGWRRVVDRADMSRLGEGLTEGGAIGEEPMQRTVTAIKGMVGEATANGVRAIVAVGTAGLRMASNRREVVDAIHAATGVEVEIISGEDEGRLAYLAATAALRLGAGTSVVFDTGGGSSQFTFGHGPTVDERFSVDVGAVRYTERFGLAAAVPPAVLGEAMAAIATDLARLDGRPAPDALVGMGGGVTNLAAVKHAMAAYDPDVVQGTVLDRAEIDRQIELYRSRGADDRRSIIGLQPKRADVILAGACIIRTIMDTLGQSSFTVSDRGLRHGVLVERFG